MSHDFRYVLILLVNVCCHVVVRIGKPLTLGLAEFSTMNDWVLGVLAKLRKGQSLQVQYSVVMPAGVSISKSSGIGSYNR